MLLHLISFIGYIVRKVQGIESIRRLPPAVWKDLVDEFKRNHYQSPLTLPTSMTSDLGLEQLKISSAERAAFNDSLQENGYSTDSTFSDCSLQFVFDDKELLDLIRINLKDMQQVVEMEPTLAEL